ncbi:MAG TPA: NAD(P)/FAD-dependent oxidoreductase, partial [Thermoanaerobaculia bacterium]
NRFAPHSHGIFGHDGSSPGDVLASATTQVLAYPTVRMVNGEVVQARSGAEGFTITLASGEVLESARIVLAHGITDELPAIPGLAERWGRSVLHCPYCHGFEFSGHRLGVLYLSPNSMHQAMLIAEWGPTTLFLNGHDLAGEDDVLRGLAERNVGLETTPVSALHGDGVELSAIELEDGRRIGLDALYIAPRNHLNSDIAERLGCDMEHGPLGVRILVNAEQETSVRGIYATGDITRFAHNATFAIADGVMAAMAIHRSLVFGPPRT